MKTKILLFVATILLNNLAISQSSLKLFEKDKKEFHNNLQNPEVSFEILKQLEYVIVNDTSLQKMKIVNDVIKMSELYKQWYPDCLGDDHEYNKKNNCLEKYVNISAINSFLVGVYILRANLKFDKSDFYGSIMDNEKAVLFSRLEEDIGVALYNMGVAYYNLGKIDSCCFKMSVAGEKGYDDAYKFISKHCIKNAQGEQTTAEEYYNRGNAKHDLGDEQGAIADFNKVIELNPNYANAYYNRGIAKHQLQDYKGAIIDYTKGIELEPKFVRAYYNRGVSKGNLGDYKGAIVDYTKAIELDPKEKYAYYSRGIAKHKLQDYKGAIVDYTKAIELEPKYGEAYYNRGNAKGNLQDINGACIDWSKAGELGYSDAYNLIKEYCK
jgi:tetratricopeptide (TPR) repeat protein